MDKVIVRFSDPVPQAALSDAVEFVGSSDDLLITDIPISANRNSGPVAYAGLSLWQTMRVISHADAILEPTDVTNAHSNVIISGDRVYLTFDCEHPRIDDVTCALVSAIADGNTAAQAGGTVGYSERHVRRIASKLFERADMTRFDWTRLAPLFTGGTTE